MATTIQVTGQVKRDLDHLKEHPRQSYNEVLKQVIKIIEELAEDKPLREDLLREIEESRAEYRKGKGTPAAEVFRRLGVS
ncbi:hypothetical protein HYS54_02420 [Candidatus Micrarchaeota archaeon]|nr:hypothetical protein [Candidatus Micrarchaeota archaeon]